MTTQPALIGNWLQQEEQSPSIKQPKNHAEGSVRSRLARKMDRWAGKVALVTGASVGIGAAISRSLVDYNVKVVGLARRLDKLQELAAELGKDHFYPIECDVKKEEDILRAFKWAEEKLSGVDILVNNAGVSTKSSIIGKSCLPDPPGIFVPLAHLLLSASYRTNESLEI